LDKWEELEEEDEDWVEGCVDERELKGEGEPKVVAEEEVAGEPNEMGMGVGGVDGTV
jgi:hypothetical protein